jgi:hypothetical protein
VLTMTLSISELLSSAPSTLAGAMYSPVRGGGDGGGGTEEWRRTVKKRTLRRGPASLLQVLHSTNGPRPSADGLTVAELEDVLLAVDDPQDACGRVAERQHAVRLAR